MKRPLVCLCLCIVWAGFVRAEDGVKTLLHIDFNAGISLDGWQDIRQNAPPQSRFGALTFESEDETKGSERHGYFSAMDPSFGVTAPLNEPYEVNERTVRVEVRAKVRCNGEAHTAGLDLSSRQYPDFPFQYSHKLASGFGVQGYQHRTTANRLYVYHPGEEAVLSPSSSAFAPMESGRHRWHDWRLVYDHVNHQLTFYLDGREVHQMEHVALGGTVLQTLWMMGAPIGIDYDHLVVEAVEKQIK